MGTIGGWLRNAGLVLAAIVVFEFILQGVSHVLPVVEDRTRPKIPRTLVDEQVGHRGNPAYPGIDARGFRNVDAVERADIVALGDSQTYGSGVAPGEAWPAVLAERVGRPVYNMAFGGYGAVANRIHLDEALALKPDIVLFALYFGNDFFDDFQLARTRDDLARANPPDRLAEVERREAAGPLRDEIVHLYRRGRKGSEKNAVVAWFTARSRVYGLIRNLVRAIEGRGGSADTPALLGREFERARAALSGPASAFASAHDDGAWRTILTAPYRFRVLDDGDPRIRAGIEAGKQAMADMAARVEAVGARFLVLLVPTKESVVHGRVGEPAAHIGLVDLAAKEAQLRAEIAGYLAARKIDHLDLLPVLRAAPSQPYFGDGDGHPNATGHDRIAGAVAETLGKSDGGG